MYVPHDLPAGDYRGTLTLSRACGPGRGPCACPWCSGLGLHPARSPQLPARDELLRPARKRARLLPAGPSPPDGLEPGCPIARTAEMADGCAPRWDDRRLALDWPAWDRRFGPLLDGSAFADLPRKGVPVERLLPAAARELADARWTAITTATTGPTGPSPSRTAGRSSRPRRRIAEHFRAKGWTETLFQGFLNNKVDFKAPRLVARVVPLAPGRAGQLPGLLGPALLRPGLPRRDQPGRGIASRPSFGHAQAGLPRRYISAAVAAGQHSTACWITTSWAAPCGPIPGWFRAQA